MKTWIGVCLLEWCHCWRLKILGWLNDSVYGGRGNWRLGEERGDLRELCLFLCLFIQLLCQHDNLHHVLKFYYIVSLKEINDSPPAGLFGAWQSTATSPQQCQNILQPLNHLIALSCLRSFVSNSAAWELKHIPDISLFQIWRSLSLNFTAEHKNVPISSCLGNHQCHKLLQMRAPASSHWQWPLAYYSTPNKLNSEWARHLHCSAQELWQFSPWTSETIMHESAK